MLWSPSRPPQMDAGIHGARLRGCPHAGAPSSGSAHAHAEESLKLGRLSGVTEGGSSANSSCRSGSQNSPETSTCPHGRWRAGVPVEHASPTSISRKLNLANTQTGSVVSRFLRGTTNVTPNTSTYMYLVPGPGNKRLEGRLPLVQSDGPWTRRWLVARPIAAT